MSFTDSAYGFGPFANLPQDWGLFGSNPTQTGYTMPGVISATPLNAASQFSTEGSVGGEVNPLNPNLSNKTNESFGGGAADTDVSAAAVKKSGDLSKALKGLQAPAAPQAQRISSPNAPQTKNITTTMAALLASMGVSPQQFLKLTGGR